MPPFVQSERKGFPPFANEYLNFKGTKLNKSRGAFVEVPYFLSKYDHDALRFYLSATAPENAGHRILLGGFCRAEQQRAGGDLGPQSVANRMLSFAYKRSDGRVPEPGEFDDEDRRLLSQVEAGFETVGKLYKACKFCAALGECLAPPKALTTCGPRGQRLYFDKLSTGLDRKAPWFQIKEDKATATTTVHVTQSVRAVDSLKTILAPILPHTAPKLHEFLGYDGQLFGTQHFVEYQEEARLGGVRSHEVLTYDHCEAIGTWTASDLLPGQALRKPAPLFKKLDESLIDEEYDRLGG